MLYSEFLERQRRFKTSLKILFPFFVFLALYVFIFQVFDFKQDNFILMILFIVIYSYYVFYLIYQSFHISLLDKYTKTFNSEGIVREIKSVINSKKGKNGYLVMLIIKNYNFIEERYGVNKTNNMLYLFINRLQRFLNNKRFKNIPIGRYQSSSFILVFDKYTNKKEIQHEITTFCKSIEKNGINSIDIKLDISIINISYDNKADNLISKLINIPKEKEQNLDILLKPDEFDILIKNAIKNEKFINHYQKIKRFSKLDEDINFYTVSTKLDIENLGIFTRKQIEYSINKNGYEVQLDLSIIKSILKQIDKDMKVVIKVSISSFKNSNFLIKLNELLKEKEIKAETIFISVINIKNSIDIDNFQEVSKIYKENRFNMLFDEFSIDKMNLLYPKEKVTFDMVSFDLEFIKNIDEENNFLILKSYVKLLKELNIKTLIRFIDKENIVEKIKEINPDYVQGFLYDKPKLLKYIKERF